MAAMRTKLSDQSTNGRQCYMYRQLRWLQTSCILQEGPGDYKWLGGGIDDGSPNKLMTQRLHKQTGTSLGLNLDC